MTDRSGDPSLVDPPVIGLTGPIGCGKSTVAAILADLGGHVIDADDLARRATAPGEPTVSAIRERFGDAILASPGVIDRGALAAIVFADPAALRDLEAIVHPAVRTLALRELQQASEAGAPFVALEAIKLVEGGLADRCTETWIIVCEPAEQRDRLRGRGLGDEDIERRIAVQGTDLPTRLEERLGTRPHRRISASGARESLRERVEDALADVLDAVFPGLPLGPVDRPSGRR